ncbi:hypothetical protein PoB_002238500 [Plakobranchus ocellatus]|uniref:Uncharacterized protein n=1 Tax=Plakobranchus ocellatus TaxID=259542 RepID=A0AAV3ZL68_9GAST|nr:hypothetical protein PoB_002238500 [Plakobranchus ocellatus]
MERQENEEENEDGTDEEDVEKVEGRYGGYRIRPEICRDSSVVGSSPATAPFPDEGPESLRSSCCGLAVYKNSIKPHLVDTGFKNKIRKGTERG